MAALSDHPVGQLHKDPGNYYNLVYTREAVVVESIKRDGGFVVYNISVY